MLDSTALLAEAHRRFTHHGEVRAAADDFVAAMRKELMPVQLGVIEDKSRSKAVRCPRRAGKTTLTPAYLAINSAQTGELNQFWGISRTRAKELAWEPLMQIIQRHNITVQKNDTELAIRWPWSPRAFTRLKGADKEKETHKKRGDRLGLAIVDESQLMPHYLKVLVEDVLEPATQDVRGTICLMGTPGPICAGFWFDVSRNEREMVAPGWSLHHWHVRDNISMPHLWEENLALKARRKWDDENPTWIREYLGRWVKDDASLVYHYNEVQNAFDTLPRVDGWNLALGVDLGSGGDNDPMAAHLWGWHPSMPELWEIESWKSPPGEPCTTRKLMEGIVKPWLEKHGPCVVQTIDTGGGGKLTAQDIDDRYGIRFEPAQKTEKHLHQKLMNDDLEEGLIKVRRNGPLAAEWKALPKDSDDPTKEHEGYDNHSSDAALYPWRLCRHHWHSAPPPPPPRPGTPEHAARIEAELERRAEELYDAEEEEKAAWGM